MPFKMPQYPQNPLAMTSMIDILQAEQLVQRTMMLQSPEDPEVTNLIQEDSEAQLALFLSKTLTNAIMMYRQVSWEPGVNTRL